MKKENRVKNNIAVYQAKNGAIELRADSEMETVGKTKKQVILTAKQLNEFLGEFKIELTKKGGLA